MSQSFAEFQDRGRRLALLTALSCSAGYTANGGLLRKYADSVGHMVPIERLAADLTWLRDSGLITLKLDEFGHTALSVAKLTERGLDVVQGRTVVVGVDQPGV